MNLDSVVNNKRDITISIVKAIGIILMVVGHSGCPQWLHHYIYMFHMPLFFFCSGYLFKPVNNQRDALHFMYRKVKGLYVPYVKFGCLFLLLHNIFYKFNIYNDTYGFGDNVSSIYGVSDFLVKALNILSMRDTEQLLGAFWFLRILLISSILLCLIFLLNKKNKINFLSIFVYLMSFLIILKICAYTFPVGSLPLIVSGILFMYIGYLYKQVERRELYSWCTFVPLCFCVGIGSYVNFSDMISFEANNVIPYSFFACVGILSILSVSSLLQKYGVAKLLIYIGDNTLIILSLHFLSFKLVSLLKIFIYDYPLTKLAIFPVINEHNDYFWLLYSFVGIFTHY